MIFRILSSLFMRRGGKLGLLFAAYQLFKGRRGHGGYRGPRRSSRDRIIAEAARAMMRRRGRF